MINDITERAGAVKRVGEDISKDEQQAKKLQDVSQSEEGGASEVEVVPQLPGVEVIPQLPATAEEDDL